MNDRTIGRAGFLGILGLGAAGLFFAKDATGLLDRAVPKSVSSIVPTSGWRIYTVGDSMPTFDPATYRLDVDGSRRIARRATRSPISRRCRGPTRSRTSTASPAGPSSNVRWGGVRIADLLEAAGAKSNVAALNFVSAESPYEDSLTLEQALLPDVMLAYEMDGGPISRPHGAPVRLVMPQMYGYKSVKWVNRIELGTAAQPGYWEQNGYDADAWLGKSNGFSS